MIKRLRFFWWYLKAGFSRYNKRLIPFFLIILGLGLIYPFLKQIARPIYYDFISPLQTPIITEGLVGTVKTINPILSSSDAEKDIVKLVFRGLTKNDSQGLPTPDLAQDFKLENEKDYTFRLRDNVFWQDGQKFTADDVVYTLKIIADPNYHSSYYQIFKDAKVSKLNDFNVKISLKEKFVPFTSFTNFGIIPAHIPLSKYRPIGTGEFRVVEATGDHVLLKGTAFNLLFRFYPSQDVALSALKLGEIQALGNLTSVETADLNGWPNLKIYHNDIKQRYVGLFFNLKNDLLADKNLRQALQIATPKADIVKLTTNGEAKEATSSLPLNSWIPIYRNNRYQFNLDEAKRMLDKSGWKENASGLRQKDNKELIITITTLDNRPYLEALAVIKDAWQQIGIKVEKLTVSSNQLVDNILPNSNYQGLLTSQEIASDPDQYDQWHSTQKGASNFVNLSSAKVDKALEAGRQTQDPDQRISHYLDFQRFLSDEAPVIFLYYPEYYYAVSSKVVGISLPPLALPSERFNNIKNWQVTKKLL